MENPIRIDDLGVPLFLETPRYSPKGTFEDDFPFFPRWDMDLFPGFVFFLGVQLLYQTYP